MVKKAKVIFLGDTAVGKSCLISALNGHPISTTHQVESNLSSQLLEWTSRPKFAMVPMTSISYSCGILLASKNSEALCHPTSEIQKSWC